MKTATMIASNLSEHLKTISPGQPFHFNSAHMEGDGVWQGDLGIELVADATRPADYIEVSEPRDLDRQLVPLDGSPGSHHRLQSLEGVRLYRPANWGKDAADLRGPCIVTTSPNAVVHEPGTSNPHGTVFLDEPGTYLCRYQRNLSEEEKALRARD